MQMLWSSRALAQTSSCFALFYMDFETVDVETLIDQKDKRKDERKQKLNKSTPTTTFIIPLLFIVFF